MVSFPGKNITLYFLKNKTKMINDNFDHSEIGDVEGVYVPESMKNLFPEFDYTPVEFVEDDNRSAIFPFHQESIPA